MTNLRDLFDLNLFNRMVDEGYVRVQTHPEFDYSIANYAEKAQFEREWNDVTLACRGLIFDTDTQDVMARGFPKFFNWDDSTQPLPPHGAMLKANKFDGSLGIAYLDFDGKIWIATRGSFQSEQANEAMEILREIAERDGSGVYAEIKGLLDSGFTPLFEIIYPENRIVVSYGIERRLVLLDVINNATGLSDLDKFDNMIWFDKAEKTLISRGFYDTIGSEIPSDEEGYVLYWPSTGFRCKVKGAEYVHLHSLLTNTSNRDIWRHMAVTDLKRHIDEPKEWTGLLGIDPLKAKAIIAMGDDWQDTFISNVPDEFYAWIQRTIKQINTDVTATLERVLKHASVLREVDPGRDRYEASQQFALHGSAALNLANTNNYIRALAYAWKSNFPATYEKPFSDGPES